MILESYTSFLDKLFAEIEKKGIDVSAFELDHLAYRTDSEDTFQNLKLEFIKLGKLVHEAFVSGNVVDIYRLNNPLKYKQYNIPAVELIGPHPNKDYPTAFEHAEFVVDENLQDFAARYPALEWDLSAISHPQFPLLKLPLAKYLQVKFHNTNILKMAEQLNRK